MSTTTTTTTTQPIFFLPDEFEDEEIADFWIQTTDEPLIVMVEEDDSLKWVVGAEYYGGADVTQEAIEEQVYPLDIFMKVSIPTSFVSECGFVVTIRDADTNFINLSFDWYDYPAEYRYNIVGQIDTSSPPQYETVETYANQNYVWLRLRWDSTGPQAFFSNFIPSSNASWIEVTPTLDTPIGLPIYPVDVELYGWNNEELEGTIAAEIEFIRNWMEAVPNWSQGANSRGTINEGFGGFGFGWN